MTGKKINVFSKEMSFGNVSCNAWRSCQATVRQTQSSAASVRVSLVNCGAGAKAKLC